MKQAYRISKYFSNFILNLSDIKKIARLKLNGIDYNRLLLDKILFPR